MEHMNSHSLSGEMDSPSVITTLAWADLLTRIEWEWPLCRERGGAQYCGMYGKGGT